MTDPLLVELVRWPLTESTHPVHVAVVDTGGAVVRSWGDAERITHPRSAAKPLQALALVETGAADAFGLGDVELALACASHSGEAGHVQAVERWLDRIGCSVADLECGVEAAKGPTPVANNCSGKHAGFLTMARHLAVDPAGYVEASHPVQQVVTDVLSEATDTPLDPALTGRDGCGIPVHPVPLRALALAAARFGDPASWPGGRAAAARRLGAAMVSEPWFVAGTGRLCTELLADGAGQVLVKVGAEGVQFAALPHRGVGIALKVEDGSVPASEIALGHVLAELEGHDRAGVFGARRQVTNHAGVLVGELRVRGG